MKLSEPPIGINAIVSEKWFIEYVDLSLWSWRDNSSRPTSVRKSGPVRYFTPWVMDRDRDRSTKVLIPQKTGLDRSRPLFSGLEPVWTSLGSSSVLTGSRPVFRPDKLKIGHVSINSIC